MKAAFNGGLNLSVLEGWWMDACIDGVTGWAIGDDDIDAADSHAQSLYDRLERTVLPLYAKERPRWIWMMKQSISKIAPRFNSQSMMRRYATEAYLR
jgi:starch phosphorylase